MNKALVIALFVVAVLIAVASLEAQRKGKKLASKGGSFSILQGEIDGHPLFAFIDMGLRDFRDKQELPFFLSVSTPLVSPTSEGLPTRNEAEDLNAWEDAVEARLRPQGKFVFVGRVSWNGRRELLYYVENQQRFVEALKSLAQARSTRQFAFACERDENWQKAHFWFNRH